MTITPVSEDDGPVERPCARMPSDGAEFADFYLGPADQRLSSIDWREWDEVRINQLDLDYDWSIDLQATQPKVMKFDDIVNLVYDADDEESEATRESLKEEKKRRDAMSPQGLINQSINQ